MATAFDSALDRELARRFARLDWHLRRVRMIRGLGWLAVVLTLLVGVAFAVDLVLKPGGGVRGLLLAGIGIGGAVAFFRAVVQPLLRRHTAAELAAVVEYAHPNLAEQLTSAVELNDPSLPEEWKGSALMREMLTRQALRSAAPLDFTASVSQSRATQASLCGIAALVLLAAPAFFAPGAYGLLWSRLFNPWGNFETPGNLSFLVEGGDRVVASGDDVEIKAEVRWRFSDDEPPANIRLHWSDVSGTADSRQMQRDPETGVYTTTLTNVFHSLEFQVAAGSDRSRSYRVEVVERPEVLTAVLDVRPPAYTGLAAHTFDGVRGELHVFEHSRLQLQLTFNKPVESAEWRWLNRTSPAAGGLGRRPAAPAAGGEGDQSSSLPLVLAADRKSATLEWTASEGGAFAFDLTDAHGLANSREPERILVITPDLPPELLLGGSSQPRKARPDDVVRLEVQASDDIGLGALELHYEIHRGDKGLMAVEPAQVRGRELAHTFELNLAELQVASGSVLTYRVRAADQRPVPGPNETWTDPRVISIDAQAGPPEATDVAERQQALRGLLDQIRRDLDANQAQVADVRRAAGEAGNDNDFARNAEIPELAGAQRELAERVEAFAGRLSEHPLFANLTGDTERVAREMLDPAARALDQAAGQPLPEKTEALENNAEHLAAADAKLTDIAARFDDLARLEQELLELNRLARQAEQLAEQALDLDRRRREAPEGETPEERQDREQQLERDRRALAGEHDALMRQLDALLERRPEILSAARQNELDHLAELSRELRELIEPQDLLADALRDEAGQAAGDLEPLAERQQELLRQAEELAGRTDARQTRLPVQPLDPELLREALAALRAGNLAEAKQRQQAAADELELLARELAKNEQLPADPQQAAAELARRQRDLNERLAAAVANPPAADTPENEHREQLRALAREQAGIQAGAAALDVPRAARERQQQSVDRAADAVEQLLGNDPARAAESSALAANDFEELARTIGTPEERAARSREAVAALRERQQQLADEARRAAAPEQPGGNAAAEERARDLQALAERQREIARQVADLDAPAAEREQHSAVRGQAAALTDLARGDTSDVPASQAQAEQALARLERRLAGEDVPAEASQDASDPTGGANALNPADQAEQLAQRQQALADRTERAAEAGDVPSEQERRESAEQSAAIRRDAEQLRAGRQAADARREALERLRKADEARRTADERAQAERPASAPAREASDKLQRLMQDDAQAQQNAADALQQLAERLNGEASREELANREQQEREQLEQLVGDNAQAAAPMNPTQPEPAAEPAAQARSSPQQADAGAAAEAARQASELARQQRELAQQTADRQAPPPANPNESPAGDSQDPRTNAAQSPDSGQIPGNEGANQQNAAGQSPIEAQQQLAREAAELAIDAARQTGPESPPAAQAAEFARESLRSAQQARQGRLADAARTAQQAAQSAQQAAEQLGDTPGAAGESLGQQAGELAQRQSAQADALEQAAESAEARRSAQQSGQEQLAEAARGLSEQLGEAAQRLGADPLDLDQPAEQARSSQQAAESSREAMGEAAQQIGRGDSGQAAESARQAAERLRQATERAAEAAGQQQPPSDVPSDVAGQVAEAARQLAEARRHLAEAGNAGSESQAQSGQQESPAAAEPGQPMPGQPPQPGESGQSAQGSAAASASGQQRGQPGSSGQSGQSPAASAQTQGSRQPGAPGSPGESSGQPGQGQGGQPAQGGSPLSQTARSLQQAARALAHVAGQGKGQPGGRGQASGQASGQQGNAAGGAQASAGGAQASAGASGDQPGGTGGANGAGSRADGPLDPATLDQELQRLSARQWGQLPGHLRTEILQAARKKGNADYERLIKLYFEEIARTQPAASNRPSVRERD